MTYKRINLKAARKDIIRTVISKDYLKPVLSTINVTESSRESLNKSINNFFIFIYTLIIVELR